MAEHEKSERDTHFLGFADLLFDQLTPDLAALAGALNDDDIQEIHKRKQAVKKLIAQRAYDLVYSAIEFLRYSPYYRPMQLSSTETWVHVIPDLTARPTDPGTS